jgi:hypothetical protein
MPFLRQSKSLANSQAYSEKSPASEPIEQLVRGLVASGAHSVDQRTTRHLEAAPKGWIKGPDGKWTKGTHSPEQTPSHKKDDTGSPDPSEGLADQAPSNGMFDSSDWSQIVPPLEDKAPSQESKPEAPASEPSSEPIVPPLEDKAPNQSKSEPSKEPVQRALDRMSDAKAKGGVAGMIKDTATRIKMTKDQGKLNGIAQAIQHLVQTDKSLTSEQKSQLLGLTSNLPAGGNPQQPGSKPNESGDLSTPSPKQPAGNRKVIEGTGGPVVHNKEPSAILPAGWIDVASGKNEYWGNDSTIEIWKAPGGKPFGVCTYGKKPSCGIGSTSSFKHDQTGGHLKDGNTCSMVGFFSIDPEGEQGGEVPPKGKLPVATYK